MRIPAFVVATDWHEGLEALAALAESEQLDLLKSLPCRHNVEGHVRLCVSMCLRFFELPNVLVRGTLSGKSTPCDSRYRSIGDT